MPDKIKIEKPKIPPSLAPTNFQEIYYKDEPCDGNGEVNFGRKTRVARMFPF